MYDASNRKDIRRAEKEALREEKVRVEFVVTAMSTGPGRRWFHNLLTRCHVFQEPFTGRALDEAYLKGQRSLGLFVYNDIVSNCPDYFVLMMKEATLREQVNAERSSQSESVDGDSESESDESVGDDIYAAASGE